MKPGFALKFSRDGLSLLRRATGGWQVIGSVALDDAELTTKLGYLRKTAAELAGGALAAKLVIPNSEILYRTIDAPGQNDAERRDAVAKALEGATPYAACDLAFDWVDAGSGKAHVAAVARITLDEAESFATEHRFNPVSFVAIPEGNAFVGEPNFGETTLCAAILPEGESVENDPGPIVIAADHDPDTAPQPEVAEAQEPVDQDSADATNFEPDLADETAPPDAGDDGPGAMIGDDAGAAAFSTRRSGLQATTDDTRALKRVSPRFALYPDKAPPAGAGPSAAKPKITPMPVTAPEIAGNELAEEPPRVVTAMPVHRPAPRRAILARDVSPGAALVADPDHRKPGAAKSVFDRPQPEAAGKSRLVGVALGLGLVAMILLAVLLSSVFFDRPIASARLLSGFSGGGNILTEEPLTAPQIVASLIEPLDAETTVLLGQPDAPAAQAPGQPGAENIAIGAAPSGADGVPQNADAPNVAAQRAPDQPPVPFQFLGESELAESEPDLLPPGEISFAEARIIEISTGVWVLAPIPPVGLEAEQLDAFYVASIDRAIAGHDAVALPALVGLLNDRRPGEFASPAPAGTVFDLDARGFVRATPQGALSADGVRIVLGPPGMTPPLRPRGRENLVTGAVAKLLLPSTRPTLRPAGLIETDERAQFGGRTRRELAAKRPFARPASPQQTGAQDLTPTVLAVLISRHPALRPGKFDTVVAKARAAQAAAKVAQAAALVAAPRVPEIPTTASVAREATLVGAINLRQVNLIGVYGSSGDRRALVRLKNGRYLKVQIGDRLDGGKVAAIDGDQLQYIKAGRMVTLEIAS